MDQRAIPPAHHRRRRDFAPGATRGFDLVEAGFALALIAVVGVLLLVAPTEPWGPVGQIVPVFIVACLASSVNFQVGQGWSTPMQVAQVPLWLLVPPAFLPLVVAASMIVGSAVSNLFVDRHKPVRQALLAAGDAWHAVGAAVMLTLLGVPKAEVAAAGTFLLIFGGQVVADALYAVLHGPIALRLSFRQALLSTLWIATVDLALLPIGFLGAYALSVAPLMAFSLVPVVFLFAEFSRERDARLSQAMELSSAYRGTAALMAQVMEDDHEYTGGEHAQGVVELALEVGARLGLDPGSLRDLEFGALLHDVGKLHVPNEILNKPGRLSEDEWVVVRRHPELGQEMLDRVGGVLGDAGRIVRAHHERYDGTGYPDGLSRQEIPLAARIITACDSYNAMTTDRAYRRALEPAVAIAELERCSGTQFDPSVVRALLWVLEERGAVDARKTGGRWSSTKSDPAVA
ncbi:MAG: HD-GYP domain-containing protein [Solirubrobacteraceae bacterium]|nr:HD-GYP domain-containing protein [Solirubrobacteraceae bacterium]